MNTILPVNKLITTPLQNNFFMRCYIVGYSTSFYLKTILIVQLLHEFISNKGTGVLKMLNDVCHKTILSHFSSYLIRSFPRSQAKTIAERWHIAKDILRTQQLKQELSSTGVQNNV